MKIPELRAVVAEHDAASLRKLAVELYKLIPKKVKEERLVDELVRNPDAAREMRTQRVRKGIAAPDAGAVLFDARWFLTNASESNYFAPNRVIPKKERGQWRHVARRVYKDLVALQGLEEARVESAELLAELYGVLCRGEEVYLFPSTAPFEAMKVPKGEMLQAVLAAARSTMAPEAFVDRALDLLLCSGSLYRTEPLVEVVVAEATAPELRDLLAERAEQRVRKLAAPPRGRKGRPPRPDWATQEKRSVLCAVVVAACAANSEPERGVELYHGLTAGEEASVAVDRLLGILNGLGLDELWVAEYDRAARDGVALSSRRAAHRARIGSG